MIESYYISKSEYGIIHLLINTRNKWIEYQSSESLQEFTFWSIKNNKYTDKLIIPISEFPFEKEKEGMYRHLEQQEKDQISFYWIPIRLLRGNEIANKILQIKQRKNGIISQTKEQ